MSKPPLPAAIVMATDLSRAEVDRAHREEMEAAREQVEQVNSWRNVYQGKVNELTDMVERLRIERTAWRSTAGNRETEVRQLRAALDRVIAERDEARRDRAAMRNRCRLRSEGNRRLAAVVADLTAERDRARDLAVRAGAFADADSRPPASTDVDERPHPGVVPPADHPACRHEALEPVGYGSMTCWDCGIHLPPDGDTQSVGRWAPPAGGSR